MKKIALTALFAALLGFMAAGCVAPHHHGDGKEAHHHHGSNPHGGGFHGNGGFHGGGENPHR